MARAGSPPKICFVAGTDTGVGKTRVSVALLLKLAELGYRTAALKPVAAGVEPGDAGNEDALLLQAAATEALPYRSVNPVLLDAAVAPHIAAAQQGMALSVDDCMAGCNAALAAPADWLVVEGAGGWWVPLNARESMADIARRLDAGVILVVGMRLGCLNHALLSAAAIAADGVPLLGWVANQIDPEMPFQQDNIKALEDRIAAPLLGQVSYQNQGLSGVDFDLSPIL